MIQGLLALLPPLLLKILPIEDIPLPTSRRDMARKRHDFLPHEIIDTIFALKKILQNLLGFNQSAALVGKISKVSFPETLDNEMSQVRNPIV